MDWWTLLTIAFVIAIVALWWGIRRWSERQLGKRHESDPDQARELRQAAEEAEAVRREIGFFR